LLAKNRFSQFSPIHELGEIQRQALNLTALCHGNAEEIKNSWRGRRSSRRRSARTWGDTSHLGFVLATRWTARTTLHRSGR
jgi:hypothetical protein